MEGINMGRHRRMHLPKPVGPYHVSFADFELRRTPGSAEQSEGDAGVEDVEKGALGAEGAPLMRFFYPTAAEPKWSPPDTQTRRWLPHFNYTWGYFSKVIIPSSFLRRFIIWALSCMHVSLSFQKTFVAFLHPLTTIPVPNMSKCSEPPFYRAFGYHQLGTLMYVCLSNCFFKVAFTQ